MTKTRPIPETEGGTNSLVDIPPVFVVGCPRSGTTLLRLMLSEHPEVFISSEGAYIAPLRLRVPQDSSLPFARLKELHHEVVPFLRQEKFISIPSYDDLREWVKLNGSHLKELITFYGTWEAVASGRRSLSWWGDNAPYHALHVPFFTKLFPNGKFIFMIRDPRDVYASFKSSFRERSVLSVIAEWQEVLLAKFLAQETLGVPRVYEVRYEDLVLSPEKELQGICKFLDIEFTPQMLCSHCGQLAKTVAELPHHANVTRPIFSESVGRGPRMLAEEEIDMIERHLCTPMKSLRYLSEEEYEDISRSRFVQRVFSR
jgi:hypothetical protein